MELLLNDHCQRNKIVICDLGNSIYMINILYAIYIAEKMFSIYLPRLIGLQSIFFVKRFNPKMVSNDRNDSLKLRLYKFLFSCIKKFTIGVSIKSVYCNTKISMG